MFIAGRYEGIDERVIEGVVDEQISLGDFVLTGGELPIMVVLDAIARYLPGTLGNAESSESESYRAGAFDWAHYTRPEHVLGQVGTAGAVERRPRRDQSMAPARCAGSNI